MRILKLDLSSGISGDMFLGAVSRLVKLEENIVKIPKALGLEKEVEISFKDVKKNSIVCRKAVVRTDLDKGNARDHDSCHNHDSHHHDSHSHGHSHSHRHLKDILKIISEADSLTANAKRVSATIFTLLAEAEAKVHDVSIDKVHFHEVGALDSIIDIIGAGVLIDALGEVRVYASSVRTGFGEVRTDHGLLSVPTPATEILLRGMPVYAGNVQGEMVTPTGAAILKYLNPSFTDKEFCVIDSNLGAGDKDFPHVNALRASLCEEVKKSLQKNESLTLIQTNLDDIAGEMLGSDLQDSLLKVGALDVFLTPIIMKKGRPGIKLEVLCPNELRTSLSDLILENTTSLGVRFLEVDRYILEREVIDVECKYGTIPIKVAYLPSGKKRGVPEYEVCKEFAVKLEIPTQEVYLEALKAFKKD